MKTQEELIQSNASTLHNTLEAVYLDWVNNFLTLEKFAEYYGLHIEDARRLILMAKRGNLIEQGYY